MGTALGMLSRALGPDEGDLHAVPIARDAVGLIVHAKSTVTELSGEQVVASYRGELTDWSQLANPHARTKGTPPFVSQLPVTPRRCNE